MAENTTSDWYAHSLADPADAYAEWKAHGVAVLPLGEFFEAVRLPEELANAAAASEVTAVVNDALAGLEGPVIHDSRNRNYYALVAPGTRDHWSSRHQVECLGHGTQLGVPELDRHRPDPGHPIYWAAAPGPGAFFCHVAALKLLIRIGTARLADREGHVVR
ncbi:hypothetical protein AB0B01_17265 [Streptomyces sp. NPDC044571]|uniref:hypothetical protein n=1 Tax=Streptomyces sp. NPDC044571 TaxID=3155371 RepID=UPI0033D87625